MTKNEFQLLMAKSLAPLVEVVADLKRERQAAPPVTAKAAENAELSALAKEISDLKAEIAALRNIEQVDGSVFEGCLGDDARIGVFPESTDGENVFAGVLVGTRRKYDHSQAPMFKGAFSGMYGGAKPIRNGIQRARAPRIKRTIGEIQ